MEFIIDAKNRRENRRSLVVKTMPKSVFSRIVQLRQENLQSVHDILPKGFQTSRETIAAPSVFKKNLTSAEQQNDSIRTLRKHAIGKVIAGSSPRASLAVDYF